MPRPRRERLPLALVALGLHALLVLGLWRAVGVPSAAAPSQRPRPALVWLPPLATPEVPKAVPPRLPSPPPRRAPPDNAAATRPPAATVPPPVPGPEPATAAITLPALPGPPASAPPLDLRLPSGAGVAARPSVRQQALDDPRANTTRPGYSERFAATLGADDTLREERIGDRVRLRRGTGCAEVADARAAQLFPMNESNAPRPKQVGECP